MEKTSKKCVEYLYPGLIALESISMEIEHNNPMKVDVKEHCIGFRFYEKEFVIDGEEQFEGKAKNRTSWFYIGKRLTFDEVQKRFGNDPKYTTLISNMKYNNISSVCMTEYGNFMPMENGDMTLEEYIAKHSKEKNAIRMFENLKKHIGEKISYKAWWYGVEQNDTGTLRNVNYFSNIETEHSLIPFIGYGFAISSITLEETGEELYSNPYIEYGYDRRSPEDIEDSRRKFFGDIIVDKQRDRRIKAEEKRKQAQERADLEAKKKKYKIMRDGLTLVKEETAEEWMQYVDINTNDAYSCCAAETSLLCLKKLQEGATCEEIEQIYSVIGLTGFMADAVSSTIAHFSPRGNEFRKYWNAQYGVSEEEKSTVNSAVLTLTQK